MDQSLKKLLVQSTGITDASGGSVSANVLKEEDKQFLEHALESTVQSRPESRLMSMMKALEKLCLESPRQPTDVELEILDVLEEDVEELHCAEAYIGMGGIKLCDRLLSVNDPQVRDGSLAIIANVALNNSNFQNHQDGIPLLKKLLVEVKGDEDYFRKGKIMSAVSSIISSNVPAIEFLLGEPGIGLDYFLNLYETIWHQPHTCTARTARVIGHIFRDFPEGVEVDPKPTIMFCRKLLEKWWEGDTTPETIHTNLQVLYSILTTRNPVIRKKLRDELGQEMKEVSDKMKSLGRDKKEAGDEAETLQNFQQALENENFGLTSETTTITPLAICP